MAASDAKFVPVRNVAYRVTFPIFDADGDLVTGAAGLDSEVSKDGGTFADCTNEATEIATSSGMYVLDLTSTEMDADTVAVIVKTSTAGAKTTPVVMYTASRDIDDLAFPTTTGRSIDVTATGEVGVDLDNAAGTLDAAQFGTGFITAAKFAAGAIDAAAVADGAIDAATFAAGAITAAAIATDAIGAAELAADAVTEIANAVAAPTAATIADAVWDETRAGHVTAGTFGEGVASVQGNVTGSVASVTGAVGSVTGSVGSVGSGGITATSIAADAIGASELAADAVAEIADAVWDEARSGHVTAGTFGEGVASVQGNVTGSVASVSGAVGSVTSTVTVGTNNDKTGYALSAAAIDAVLDDSLTELAAVPAAAPTLRQAVQWLYQMFRNRVTATSTATTVQNDAGSAIATATVSDDGTTFTRGEYA